MPATQEPLYKYILYTEVQVAERINDMAQAIVDRYRDTDPLFVCLLNGAQPFTCKLMMAIQRHDPGFRPNVQSMIISRYGPSRQPAAPRLVTDLAPDYRVLTGRHVILLDDLIDGGGTTAFAEQHLYKYGARKVELIVLVKKIKDPPIASTVAMYGFEAPDVWLTGMGMDDRRLGPEANRWAEWIAAANDA